MRIDRILLIVVLIAWVSPSGWAQSPEIVRVPSEGLIGKIPDHGTASASLMVPSETTTTQATLGDGTPVEIHHISWPPPLRVASIKLIVPGVGWALASRHLFWTTDNGVHWKDITPTANVFSDEKICDVFFLDTHHAWVLLARRTKIGPKFDIAYSGKAGAITRSGLS
jgi:hypothetical protein